MRIILFNLLLVAVCGFAFWRGGSPERIVAAIYLAAGTATRLIWLGGSSHYANVEWGLVAVDVPMLFALLAVALKADRQWTMTVAALQVLLVGIHVVKLLKPEIFGWIYAVTATSWSYPMVIILALGTYRHRRRLMQNGVDNSWSGSSVR